MVLVLHLVWVQREVCVQQLPGVVVRLPLVDLVGGVSDLHVHGSVGHPLVLEAFGPARWQKRSYNRNLTAPSDTRRIPERLQAGVAARGQHRAQEEMEATAQAQEQQFRVLRFSKDRAFEGHTNIQPILLLNGTL